MNRAEYEEHVSKLTGHRLVAVLYHELDYHDAEGRLVEVPYWNWSPDFDSLDYGLTFETADGAVFRAHSWNVSETSRWSRLLNSTIDDVALFWSWNSLADWSNRGDYPQDLRLKFSNGARVYVSACEIRAGGKPWPMTDHITVFFGDEAAQRYGVGPFAPVT